MHNVYRRISISHHLVPGVAMTLSSTEIFSQDPLHTYYSVFNSLNNALKVLFFMSNADVCVW